MNDTKVEYAQKLAEFIAEAQEELEGDGLALIDQYGKEVTAMLEKAGKVLEYVPEEQRGEISWQLYQVMIRKNDEALEAAQKQPFFTASECVHYVMNCWLRILKEMEDLTPNRVRSEIIRCENLCKESRKGYLPGRRALYKAYMSNNHGVSYGKWFREELNGRW
jgi:hypothetical protein